MKEIQEKLMSIYNDYPELEVLATPLLNILNLTTTASNDLYRKQNQKRAIINLMENLIFGQPTSQELSKFANDINDDALGNKVLPVHPGSPEQLQTELRAIEHAITEAAAIVYGTVIAYQIYILHCVWIRIKDADLKNECEMQFQEIETAMHDMKEGTLKLLKALSTYPERKDALHLEYIRSKAPYLNLDYTHFKRKIGAIKLYKPRKSIPFRKIQHFVNPSFASRNILESYQCSGERPLRKAWSIITIGAFWLAAYTIGLNPHYSLIGFFLSGLALTAWIYGERVEIPYLAELLQSLKESEKELKKLNKFLGLEKA